MKAANFRWHFALIILAFLMSNLACNPKENKQNKTQSTKLNYARFFRIIKHEAYTEIRIINPDDPKKELKLALGRKVHELKLESDLIPIQTPIKSIITLNGTEIGMLAKLDCINAIKGVASASYVDNAELKKGLKKGSVAEFGDFQQMDPEKVLQVASLITYSGFGKPPANEDKLRKLGVVCIPMYDWREMHPLGKAEWIRLLSCLFEKENQAENYMKKISDSYFDLLATAKKATGRPVVLSGSMIGDSWFMPAAQSFNAQLYEQAGCSYVGKTKPGTGSAALSFEEVYAKFKDADIWISPMLSCKKELLGVNSKYAYFKAFQEGNVYCYSHNMNHFWENSAVEPQKVLSDLIQIFHAAETGKSKIPKKKLYFYRKINP